MKTHNKAPSTGIASTQAAIHGGSPEKKEKCMFTAKFNELELLETWAQEDSEIRVKFAPALSSANGTTSTQVVYVNVEPGMRLGRHSHNAEEILLILEGTMMLSMGGEQQQLSAGEVALIPAGMIHDQINVGSETVRCVAFFSSAAILHDWEMPLMPIQRFAMILYHLGISMPSVLI